MKKLFLVLTLLICTSDAWAANRYARTVGGNWTDNATWSTTSGGAADTVAPTASDDVFLDANSGQVTISASSVGKSLTCTGYTGTLTHNNFNLLISGNITFVAGMTYTPNNTSAVLSFQSNGTFISAGKTPRVMSIGSNTTMTLGDNLTFFAAKTCELQLGTTAAVLNLNGFTLSGDSATNRLLVRTQGLGTARTITNTTGTFANADFRDITFSTAADYSAITGLSGDCGGNTNITFTTAATQTATGNSANWSAATWTSRVPLPQDDVVLSLTAGQTLTNDMPRMGKSISVTTAMNLSTNTIAQTLYGSLDLTNVATFTSGTTGSFTFEGRGAFTLTSAGKSFGGTVTLAAIGGSLTQQDAASFVTSTTSLNISAGTYDANDFNVTGGYFTAITTTFVRGLNMGNGTWTASGTDSVNAPWRVATTNLTFNAENSTILLSNTGATAKTFTGGGATYNNLQIAGGGAGAIIITGANTFNRIYTDGGGTKSITLPGSTNTTILSNLGLNNGTNLITFTASSGSATIVNSSGDLAYDYVSLTNIPCSGAGRCYAGPLTHSTDGGGNTNWIFELAPASGGIDLGSSIIDDEEDFQP